MFVWARLGPGEQHRPIRQAELVCERFRYQIGLVVAALSFPLTVQGYWNHYVSDYALAPHHLEKSLAEPAPQWLYTLELQHDDRPHEPTFVEGVAARAIKAVSSSLAVWARQGLWPGRILAAQRPSRQRLAAYITQPTANRRERAKILSANW